MRLLGCISLAALAAASCVGGDPVATTPVADGGVDSGVDAVVDSTAPVDAGGCDALAPFTTFERVSGDVNTPDHSEVSPTLTDDETEMVFYAHGARNDGGVFGDHTDHEIWVARRTTRSDPWSAAIVGELASKIVDGGVNGTGKTGIDLDPAISGDGLVLVYATQRGGFGPYELFMTTRPSRSVAWGTPTLIESLSSTAYEVNPHFSADGRRLYFVSDRTGSSLIYEAEVNGGKVGAPSPLAGPINDLPTGIPVLSADGLTIYVNRKLDPNDARTGRILRATRGSTTQAFGAPVMVDELVRGYGQGATWLSRDNCRLYFAIRENADDDTDLWVASR